MRIIFDLDGVIRDLVSCTDKNINDIKEWDYFNVSVIDKNPELILRCKPTEYYPIIKKFFNNQELIIYTHQRESWKKYTESWCKKYLQRFKIYYFDSIEEKLNYLDSGDYLIEDYPFKNILDKNIVLIDRPYNKSGKCKIRILSPIGLKYFLIATSTEYKRVFSLSKSVEVNI